MKPSGAGGRDQGFAERNAGMGGEVESSHDVTAPSVLMVTTAGSNTPWPDTGAVGIKEDAVIVVVFSEPMDTTKTQDAYSSTDLPASAVKFSWDATKTRLSLQPLAKLKYAEVSDPAAQAQQYTFVIGTGAGDVAGNRLLTSKTVVFRTMRHITHSLSLEAGGGTVITLPDSGPSTNEIRCESANSHLSAGDDEKNEGLFSVAIFDLSSLPDGIVDWAPAALRGMLGVTPSTPYGRLGDSLHAYATSGDPRAAAWDSVGTDLGEFGRHTSATDGAVDVSAVIQADYAARESKRNVSEYLFRFDEQTNGDGTGQLAYIYCDDLRLDLEYYAP